ncbi:membrane protein [Xenorhabdus eapokensis]|uniref:Membrane protein n=1 Tax=Xenorhabdus eapokensis TaxID=1873482 RepID=A0A1Q5TJY3_9GAMM|nr:membrane protein [Xenorhabdus eapokensis]
MAQRNNNKKYSVSTNMAIYELAQDTLIKVEMTSFEAEKLKERQDIQRFLKSQIEAISPDIAKSY